MLNDTISSSVSVQTAKDRTGSIGSVPLPQTAAPFPATLNPSLPGMAQKENVDGPDHKYQVNAQLLYEREFPGHTYVSAHLQRLQHGVFDDDMVHDKDTLFESTIIEITARSENEPLRFVKFAPHLAYGRISSENLKWNFQLGATVGITKGPATLSTTVSQGYEKDKVLGTMMKIQGSTRSKNLGSRKSNPDTKLVWSMEENDQQMTGLPREFTFVFLVARPAKAQALHKNAVAEPGKNATPYTAVDYDATFSPMYISTAIKPHISNILATLTMHDFSEEARIEHEAGQRLEAATKNSAGYYNFAKMPGNFEDLVELPGNAVTSAARPHGKLEQKVVTDDHRLGTNPPSLEPSPESLMGGC